MKAPSRRAWTSSPDATKKALSDAETDGINLGVRLDAETLVVDVDPRNFADGVDSLQRLSEAVGVDLYKWTPKTETGGGGLHLWMRKAPDLRVRAGLSAEYPGIDFKTRGGQVVAPGSIHPDTGQPYILDDFLGEIGDPAPVPDELGMILRRDRQAPTFVREEDRVMLEPDEVAELLEATGEVAEYEDWIKVLMACHAVSGGMAMVECQEWSWPDASRIVEDKWAGFDARGNDNGRVGWGTLRHLAIEHGGEKARAVCDRLERSSASEDFEDALDHDELPEDAIEESAATSELKEWIFVAESMSFVRRKDCQKFRPEAFNAMLAHHKVPLKDRDGNKVLDDNFEEIMVPMPAGGDMDLLRSVASRGVFPENRNTNVQVNTSTTVRNELPSRKPKLVGGSTGSIRRTLGDPEASGAHPGVEDAEVIQGTTHEPDGGDDA